MNVLLTNLDQMNEIVLTVGDKTITVNYSVLTYAAKVIGGSYDESLQYLSKALYVYNAAAKAYFTQD